MGFYGSNDPTNSATAVSTVSHNTMLRMVPDSYDYVLTSSRHAQFLTVCTAVTSVINVAQAHSRQRNAAITTSVKPRPQTSL